ncbi:MAG TPA: hypothetical protein ENI92_01585 [Bacteroidetes bacterium]|nr:hypothetical protein [Bacteroidota bacterium]
MRLDVFNLLGQREALLHQGVLQAGRWRLTWRPESPVGACFLRASAGGSRSEVCKLVFLK